MQEAQMTAAPGPHSLEIPHHSRLPHLHGEHAKRGPHQRSSHCAAARQLAATCQKEQNRSPSLAHVGAARRSQA